ncbi:MAG: GNAT family N-acetyltransferase [Ktedonobacteraceae bacterium]|nr:GNAT family N-acetyltransferase [Ktedonobacteraceae bacterium]
METFAIRPATHQDIDGLISLYAEFHEFHVTGVPDRLRKPDTYDEATLRSTLLEIIQQDDAQIFVADHEGKLVALAEVYLRQDEPQPLTVAHRYGYLQSLIVSAPFRKAGLGKQLAATAHQWAKDQQATEMQVEIWEFTEGPLHFYEALGYRTLRRHLVTDLH